MDDPSAELSERQAQKIKKHVKEFLDKAVVKFNGHQERKSAASERRAAAAEGSSSSSKAPLENGTPHVAADPSPSSRDDAKLADDEILSDADIDITPASSERKRKRTDDGIVDSPGPSSLDSRDLKRMKGDEGEDESPASPPPPPPPPAAKIEVEETEEKKALREQEEALMRENEEAQRLEDEANRTQALETAAEEMKQDISAAKTAEVLSH